MHTPRVGDSRHPRQSHDKRLVLGVLGGMGPAATADFLSKLVRATPAGCDQHHIPVVVRSFPQIPDRSDAILSGGESPLPAMLDGIRWLAASHVDAIAIPCNTAHRWYCELQESVDVPILHIADAVRDVLNGRGYALPVALFATQGTLQAQVFERRALDPGLSLLPSDPIIAGQITAAIHAVKAHQLELGDTLFRAATAGALAMGAQLIVLACTELPLLPSAHSKLYLDSTDALAQFCVKHLHHVTDANIIAKTALPLSHVSTHREPR